jgi:BlaI family transcriptional regulator, penicillinase repressor
MTERISDSEYAVMDVLWRSAPASAAQVGEALTGSRDWSIQTVKTLLSRLVAKGVVGAEEDGRRYLYRPLVERDDHASRESQRLVDRLFGGRISPLVAQFAERETLSEADIAELKALIERLES